MRLLLAIAFLLCALSGSSQVDSVLRADTAVVEQGFAALPGMPKSNVRLSAHSVVDASLKESGQFAAGISVYNTARGRVPGMQIDPYYQVDTLTWRNNSPLVVVDGVAFNQSIGNYYNLNAFEYDDMQMILGRNGTIAYGGGGGNRGAIVLHSRSGEGFTKPTFDFNTYTTYAWNNDYYSTSQWQLSNSLAYAQDFGKLDLRVSTNYTAQPPGDTGFKGPSFWRLKANVGYTLERFSARLILNGNTGSLNQSTQSGFPGGPLQSYTSQAQDDLLQGNLVMSYRLTDWLSISSQASRSHLTNDQKSASDSYSQARTYDYRLDAGNFLLHANKSFSDAFSVTATAGWMGNSILSNATGSSSTTSGLSTSYEVTTHSMFASAEFGFKNKLFLGSTFRRDFADFYIWSDAYSAYSVFSSYSFNHLIDPAGKVLSFAKIRASYGHNDNRMDTSVPRVGTLYPFRSVQSAGAFETGLEAGFMRGRIQFMVNYFQNKSYSPGPMTAPIDPATGYTVTTFGAYYNTILDGFELLARMKVLEKKRITLTTQLIAGWNTTSIERLSGSFVSGNYDWPSPYPDWTGGWLNQVTFGKFSLSMLIDISMGGYVYGTNPSVLSGITPGTFLTSSGDSTTTITVIDIYNNNTNLGSSQASFHDQTFVKIRDLTVAYNLSLFTKMKGYVSLSMRNLVTVYKKADFDPEIVYDNRLNKSVSINFGLQF